MRSSAKYRPTETSYISADDHFAALQIDFAFEGGLRGLGGTAACTIPISSRTMSVQLREIPLPLQKNAAYYTPSPSQKQVARKVIGYRRSLP